MTTIAYRDGVMAADTRGYSGDKTPIGSKTKIVRCTDGSLLGVSSTVVGAGVMVARWTEAGCPHHDAGLPKPASFSALRVLGNGEVYYANDVFEWSGPLTADFFAVGSGEQYALGAMARGATAVEAVEISAQFDPWSAIPVTSLTL